MVTFYRRLPKFDYLTPKSIDEVLALLDLHKGRAKVVAGGTDIVPKLKRREIKAPEYVIDLKGITGLNYIEYDDGAGLRIGALTTIHDIETSSLIRERCTILFQAASSIGSVQIRNMATIAGNICNAVPSADTAPALLVLEAQLRLISQRGERIVDIEDFFTGPNKTVLKEEEILQEISIPKTHVNCKGSYLKLTQRHSMDLAVVGVAALVITEDEICQDIKIALGAVSPTPMRVKKAESILKGQRLNTGLIDKAAQTAANESKPISDLRASEEYRREMVKVLTRRAIEQAIAS